MSTVRNQSVYCWTGRARPVQQLQHALREPWTDLRERRTALRERRTVLRERRPVLRERRTRCASAMCSDPSPRSAPIPSWALRAGVRHRDHRTRWPVELGATDSLRGFAEDSRLSRGCLAMFRGVFRGSRGSFTQGETCERGCFTSFTGCFTVDSRCESV